MIEGRGRLVSAAMPWNDELADFIASGFPSVWSLELLLILKNEGRPVTTDGLVTMLRASRSVVENSLEVLIAGGLASGDGTVFEYRPIDAGVALLVEKTEELYRSRPDRVRRWIVASSNKGLAAFSDAFRLKD